MAEPKPLASLTSGLLARKGAAQPAMRRQMTGFGRAPVGAHQDDLGWNDMGFDIPAPQPAESSVLVGLTPMTSALAAPVPMPVPASAPMQVPVPPVPVPPVMVEREALAERIADVAPLPQTPTAQTPTAQTPMAQAPMAQARKSAFTLRLDADRHLKLRLACVLAGRSAQQIVTEALDIFLDTLPDIDRLTQQLPHTRGGQGLKGG